MTARVRILGRTRIERRRHRSTCAILKTIILVNRRHPEHRCLLLVFFFKHFKILSLCKCAKHFYSKYNIEKLTRLIEERRPLGRESVMAASGIRFSWQGNQLISHYTQAEAVWRWRRRRRYRAWLPFDPQVFLSNGYWLFTELIMSSRSFSRASFIDERRWSTSLLDYYVAPSWRPLNVDVIIVEIFNCFPKWRGNFGEGVAARKESWSQREWPLMARRNSTTKTS